MSVLRGEQTRDNWLMPLPGNLTPADYAFRNIHYINDDRFMLEGFIFGRPNSPYEGAMYAVQFFLPVDYPFKPPVFVRIIGDLYHMNFNTEHNVTCCQQKVYNFWMPRFSFLHVFNFFENFLQTCNVTCCVIEHEKHLLFHTNPQEYYRLARQSALQTRAQEPEEYEIFRQLYNTSLNNARWVRRKSFCLFLHGCRFSTSALPDVSSLTIGVVANQVVQTLGELHRPLTSGDIADVVASEAFQQVMTDRIAELWEGKLLLVTQPHKVFDVHDLCWHIASFL